MEQVCKFLTLAHLFLNHIFCLNNLLHVPTITKYLISVSQFARDNRVFFEFHPDDCFVKDLTTGQLLLQGKLHKWIVQISAGKGSSHK